MYLHELNTFDDILAEKRAFVISFGSVEQHGPFGPLGTDYLVQTKLIKLVEKRLKDVIFLPVMPFGACSQHVGFKGTVSLQETTLYAIMTDIVESLKDRASMILFVSWHGGNKPVGSKFLEDKSSEYPDIRMKQVTFGDDKTDEEVEKMIGGLTDDHAGNTEVSLMLAIDPTITRQPHTDDSKKPNSDYKWDRKIIEVQPDGVIDAHPKWIASPEIGEKLLTIYANNLAQKINQELSELS